MARSSLVSIEGVGDLPVAAVEELVAMKVPSMDERRLQDRIDAMKLLEVNQDIDVQRVRDDLTLIERRGFHRRQDLAAKLEPLLMARETI